MGWTRHYTQFSAGDAERITGLDANRQRDFRRHGYLPPLEAGRAKFDAKTLARMLALKALADVGVAPSFGHEVAGSCEALISARVLSDDRAISDPQDLRMGEPLIRGAEGLPERHRWLVVRPQAEKYSWAATPADLAAAVGAASVVVDLFALGDLLLDRAGVLVTIEREAT